VFLDKGVARRRKWAKKVASFAKLFDDLLLGFVLRNEVFSIGNNQLTDIAGARLLNARE